MTFSYVGFDRSSENFCLTLLTVSITMTCKRMNLSFTLFMAFKDNVHGGKMGVLRLNVPHMLAHGTCGITYFSQPSGFPIAILVLMHGPAQNTAEWEIHTCLKDTK
jgi:hypothetical protein